MVTDLFISDLSESLKTNLESVNQLTEKVKTKDFENDELKKIISNNLKKIKNEFYDLLLFLDETENSFSDGNLNNFLENIKKEN